jgi:hypothetical protein
MTGMPPQRAAGSRAPERVSAHRPASDAALDEHDEALAEEIVRRLEERGLPSGAWLADVARVRRALQEADTLLRRLQEAIIAEASSSPRGES